MRLEIIIDKKHQVPTSTMEALGQELLNQLGDKFPTCMCGSPPAVPWH